jgi:hypothetical protein
MMDWQAALDIVIARTSHLRYRELCDEGHPDHLIHRQRIVEKATGQAPTREAYPSLFVGARNLAGADAVPDPPIDYPPVVEQAGNLARSLWRWALTGFKVSDRKETKRRLAICLECPEFDPKQGRCKICGCVAKLKSRLASDHCPINKW